MSEFLVPFMDFVEDLRPPNVWKDFIERLKRGSFTFDIKFVPYWKEKDMVEEVQFVTDLPSNILKDSIMQFSKETLKNINEDIAEITKKRKELFEELKVLHEKETMLVGQLRAFQLQDKLVR